METYRPRGRSSPSSCGCDILARQAVRGFPFSVYDGNAPHDTVMVDTVMVDTVI
ncbi:MAG: hypothetical protein IJ449_12790 [Clostridia bacterium]|nr:hypothetical protein [Clostridia bacterium]